MEQILLAEVNVAWSRLLRDTAGNLRAQSRELAAASNQARQRRLEAARGLPAPPSPPAAEPPDASRPVVRLRDAALSLSLP